MNGTVACHLSRPGPGLVSLAVEQAGGGRWTITLNAPAPSGPGDLADRFHAALAAMGLTARPIRVTADWPCASPPSVGLWWSVHDALAQIPGGDE